MAARFSAIDDHEILEFTAESGNLPLARVPATLLTTEVGSPGATVRYRPVYQLIRLVEVSLWGTDPSRYYLARAVLFSSVLFMLAWIAVSALGLWRGLLLASLAFDLPFWGDIWARLGPAEQYASVGFALFSVGLAAVVRHLWARDHEPWDLAVAAMAIGCIIAAGSKENFLFLNLPLLAAGAYGALRHRLRAPALALAALSLVFSGCIAAAVLSGVLRAGTDVYRQDVSAGHRIGSLARFVEKFLPLGHLPSMRAVVILLGACLFALLVVLGASLRRKLGSEARAIFDRRLQFVAIINLCALLEVAWEIVFYNGALPTGSRYDFPAMLYLPLLIASAMILASDLLPSRKYWNVAFDLMLIAAIPVFIALKHYPAIPLREAVTENIRVTQTFDGDLDQVARRTQAHPDWPVFVEVDHARDYEASATLPVFLKWKQVANPLFLRVHASAAIGGTSDFSAFLMRGLQEVSLRGLYRYTPLREVNGYDEHAGRCYSISYSAPVSPYCTPLLLRWH